MDIENKINLDSLNSEKAINLMVCSGQKIYEKYGFYPITFSLQNDAIINTNKEDFFSNAIPGTKSSHQWCVLDKYYDNYKKSNYAYTWKKGGWDCNRHTEILMNSCTPYMPDIKDCPHYTMYFYPKNKFQEILNTQYIIPPIIKKVDPPINIEIIEREKINENLFDKEQYLLDLQYLVKYSNFFLTCDQMLKYILTITNNLNSTKILFLYCENIIDYLGDSILYAFLNKQIKNNNTHIYCNFDRMIDSNMIDNKYTFYHKNIKNIITQTEFDIILNIKNNYYDLIIIPDNYRNTKIVEKYNLTNYYKSSQIICLNGQDNPLENKIVENKCTHFYREIDINEK